MTISPMLTNATRRVADYVTELFQVPRATMSDEEIDLAIHLRGNTALFEALLGLIRSRMSGRANLPEPSDPLVAKSMIARDRELQWLLSRLEFLYRSAVNAAGNGEPPA